LEKGGNRRGQLRLLNFSSIQSIFAGRLPDPGGLHRDQAIFLLIFQNVVGERCQP